MTEWLEKSVDASMQLTRRRAHKKSVKRPSLEKTLQEREWRENPSFLSFSYWLIHSKKLYKWECWKFIWVYRCVCIWFCIFFSFCLSPAVSIGINARTYWGPCAGANTRTRCRWVAKIRCVSCISPPSTKMLLPSYSSRQCHATCEHMHKHMHELSNGPTEDERDEDE